MCKVLAGVAIATAFFSTGCSSTIAVRRPLSSSALVMVNEAIEERSAEVTLAGKAEAELPSIKNVVVGRDSTTWLEPGTPTAGYQQSTRSVPTAALQQISVRWHGVGAAEGLGLGLLGGLLTGALVGATTTLCFSDTNDRRGAPCEDHFLPAIIGAVFGAILGVPFGAAIGGAVGHRTTIEFDPPGQR